MKRRNWVRLLSCVVALLLPMSAMAQSAAIDLLKQAKTDGKEIVSTVTFVPGKTLAADQAVADLSAAASLRFNKVPGGYGAFALVLKGVDTVAAQMRAMPEGVFVQSETLGDKPLYFSWADISKSIVDSMKNSGANQASIDQFSAGFMTGIQNALAAGDTMAAVGTGTEKLTEEQIKQQITASMGGDDSFVKWIETVEAKKVVTAGTFTLGDSDTADTKTELTVTKEDVAGMYDLPYIQKQIAMQLKVETPSLTEEQLTAKTAESVDKIKAEILKSDMTMPITVYTKGEDDFVGMEFTLSGLFTVDNQADMVNIVADGNVTAADTAAADTAAATESVAVAATPAAPVKMDIHFLLNRKTTDPAKLYTFQMTAKKDDKQQVDMTGTFRYDDKTADGKLNVVDANGKTPFTVNVAADYTDAKHVTGSMDMTVNDAEQSNAFVFAFDQTTGDATIDTSLSLSKGASVEAIKADAETALLGTLKVNMVVQDDSGFFSSLKEATPATSVEVLQLNPEALKAYMSTLQTNAMQTLYKLLGNLPASVSNAAGGMMTGK